jgi:hypothetical protein
MAYSISEKIFMVMMKSSPVNYLQSSNVMIIFFMSPTALLMASPVASHTSSEGNSVEQCKEQMPNLRHEKPGS